MAIVVFATIGQLNHEGGVSLGGYAADLLPLLGAWLVVARLTGRFVPTWLIGVTLGVLVRMAVLGHYHWNQLSFLLVALVFIGAVAGGVILIRRSRTWFPRSGTRFMSSTRRR